MKEREAFNAAYEQVCNRRQTTIREIAWHCWKAARASIEASPAQEAAEPENEWTPKDPEARFWRDRFNECAPYLKEGETPLQRIERDHRDTMALMRLLAAEKIKNEALMSANTGQAAAIKEPPPASVAPVGWLVYLHDPDVEYRIYYDQAEAETEAQERGEIAHPVYLRAAISTQASEARPEPVAWRPIETAPKDRTNVLLFVPPKPGLRRAVILDGAWFGDFWCAFNADRAVQRIGPTHWMPLPAAPLYAAPPPAMDKTSEA